MGSAVALSGSTVLISRPLAWPGAPSASGPLGTIYNYSLSGAETQPADILYGDAFGYATAVNGTTYLVGAPGHNDSIGAVYAYTRANNSTLTLQATLKAPGGQDGDCFGTALAFNGTLLVVGAPYANNGTGAVYVYTLSSGSWSEPVEVMAGDGQVGVLAGGHGGSFSASGADNTGTAVGLSSIAGRPVRWRQWCHSSRAARAR